MPLGQRVSSECRTVKLALASHTICFRVTWKSPRLTNAFDSTTSMSTFLTLATKRRIGIYSAPTRELVNRKSEVTTAVQQPQQRRSVSDYGHFYRNRQLELYAAKEARRLTLRQLVSSPFQPFWLVSRSPQPKNQLHFLGLVRPLDDSREVDQSEGAPASSRVVFNDFPPPLRARIMYGRSCQFGYRIVCGTCKHYRTSS